MGCVLLIVLSEEMKEVTTGDHRRLDSSEWLGKQPSFNTEVLLSPRL